MIAKWNPKPLEILKKGLNNFSKKIKAWKDTLHNAGGHENIDIKDIKDGGHSHVDPCPTYCDVLKAVSTICRYLEDLNDPIAQKMVSGDTSIGQHLRQNMSVSILQTHSISVALCTSLHSIGKHHSSSIHSELLQCLRWNMSASTFQTHSVSLYLSSLLYFCHCSSFPLFTFCI